MLKKLYCKTRFSTLTLILMLTMVFTLVALLPVATAQATTLKTYAFVDAVPNPSGENGTKINVGGFDGYERIQDAVDVAHNGDTIRIAEGVYNENVVITGSKAILLQGGWSEDFKSRTNDSSLTIIDGGGRSSVLSIQSYAGDNLNLEVEGLTIRNGKATDGGGIKVFSDGNNSNLELTMRDNTLERNIATNNGGGFMANSYSGSNLSIFLINNTISSNNATAAGGGVWLNSHHSTLYVYMLRNNIIHNYAFTIDGGGLASYASDSGANTTVVLENNIVSENVGEYGGGLFFYSWGPSSIINVTLTNNIIAYNHAPASFGAFGLMSVGNASAILTMANNDVVYNYADASHNGGIFVTSGGGNEQYPFAETDISKVEVTMKNDIVWGNKGNGTPNDVDIYSYLEYSPADVTASYSIIYAYTNYQSNFRLENCANQDPKFVDHVNQNFHLQDNSPAIDAGDPNPQYNDAQSPPGKNTNRCDMGCYGGYNNYKWLSTIIGQTDPFVLLQEHALTVAVSGSGITSPAIGTYTYEEGTEATVTAFPYSDWIFDHWTLDSVNVGSTNPYTVTMNENHTLTAVFTEIPPSFEVTTHNVVIEQNAYVIETCSNSSLSGLVFNPSLKSVRFNVEGTSGTTGLCNIAIPTELMSGDFSIYKDDILLVKNVDYNEIYNGTHYMFSIKYGHSNHLIEIIATITIPEFPAYSSMVIIGIIATVTALAIEQRLTKKQPRQK